MTVNDDFARFQNLSYERFRELAQDASLSEHERIGFPDSYRAGKAELILKDIVAKVSILDERRRMVVDVGPGAGELGKLIVEFCRTREHMLHLIDSAEVLAYYTDTPEIVKITGRFPQDCADFISRFEGQIDVLISYSVFHYIFEEDNSFRFVDQCLRLLAPGGQFLLGDIPNHNKRKRFFSSERGREFHKRFMRTTAEPEVRNNVIEPGSIDDAVIVSVILRCRDAGFDAYWLPQTSELPMSNRREDLLVIRP